MECLTAGPGVDPKCRAVAGTAAGAVHGRGGALGVEVGGHLTGDPFAVELAGCRYQKWEPSVSLIEKPPFVNGPASSSGRRPPVYPL